ncbi:MAG: 50S ribosomal protein L29 [Nanoarchaeota archaeon]
MKIKEIRNLSEKDLNNKLSELEDELIKLNAQAATGTQMKSPGKIRQIKKVRARVKTVLKERGTNNYE